MGTLDSRLKETLPAPPLPALTRTTTRSMNTVPGSMIQNAFQQTLEALLHFLVEQRPHQFQCLMHFARRSTGIQRTVQMRMPLTLLPVCGAYGHDAQLTPPQVQRLATTQLSVAVHDHPCLQRRMKRADVRTEPLVKPAIHQLASGLPSIAPILRISIVRSLIVTRRFDSGRPAPFSCRIETAREAAEHI